MNKTLSVITIGSLLCVTYLANKLADHTEYMKLNTIILVQLSYKTACLGEIGKDCDQKANEFRKAIEKLYNN